MTRYALAVVTLIRRELVRFVRQPSRVIGVVGSPVVFWLLIGSGLEGSFRFSSGSMEMSYLEYFFPGTIVLIILFTGVFSTISLIEDRREGFMQSVLAAPIPRSSLVLGKVLGVTILALSQGMLLLLLAPALGLPLSMRSIFLLIPVLFLVALGISSFGFLIAWRMDSTQGFHAVMNLLLIPMWMLSGALFPASGAATWLSPLMYLNPLTYSVNATRLSFYGVGWEEAGAPSFGLSIGITALFAVIAFVASVAAARSLNAGLISRQRSPRLTGSRAAPKR